VFTGVFGKQYGLNFVITSRVKPEILGHVVHCFSSVHQVYRLLYEQDETVWRFSTEKNVLKLHKLNEKIKYNTLKIKVFRQILYIHFV